MPRIQVLEKRRIQQSWVLKTKSAGVQPWGLITKYTIVLHLTEEYQHVSLSESPSLSPYLPLITLVDQRSCFSSWREK